MIPLILGLIVFFAIHLVPTSPALREGLVERFGENTYKGLFSLASVIGLVLLVWSYAQAPFVTVWTPPAWTRHLTMLLMIPAAILVVAAYIPGRIRERLRHPFLIGVKTWALAHLVANGDLASMLLFGAFLAYAVCVRVTLKTREVAAAPGLAPAPGRNDAIAVGVGLAVYALFVVWLHEIIVGVPLMV